MTQELHKMNSDQGRQIVNRDLLELNHVLSLDLLSDNFYPKGIEEVNCNC